MNRTDYLSAEDEQRLVTVSPAGVPNLRLRNVGGRLELGVKLGFMRWGYVSFRSRALYRLGIYTFRPRGVTHHRAAIRRADTSPGRPAMLVREPGNEHDPNAIAVRDATGRHLIAFVNKQNAARMAKILDEGGELEAIFTSGSRSGHDDEPVTVLVAAPHLLRAIR